MNGAPYSTLRPFLGPANPRHARILAALERGPVPRFFVDTIAGAANGPALIRQLRQRGLDVPCTLLTTFDIDGRTNRPGIYSLSQADRVKLAAWRGVPQGVGDLFGGLAL